ncbi:MAG: hypothetical protein ACI4VH_05010 [Clostridia bacterium]
MPERSEIYENKNRDDKITLIDNTNISADIVAKEIKEKFRL